MNKENLIDLLGQVADSDLEDGHDIFDHPCTVAIRAINQCFDDVDTLRDRLKSVSSGFNSGSARHSKKVTMLVAGKYDPDW